MARCYQETDYGAMSRRAAHIIAAESCRNPACVLRFRNDVGVAGDKDAFRKIVAAGVQVCK